jgi:iron complex transport system substrate-binding protein
MTSKVKQFDAMWQAALFLSLFYLTFTNTAAKAADRKKEYTRIVSLAPSITEAIYLLQKNQSLVGVTKYCTFPEAAQRKTIVGDVLKPDLEKVVSLSPDLVLTTREINSVQTLERLAQLGLTTHTFSMRRNFADMTQELILLGKLLNQTKLAQEIVQSAEKKLTQISIKPSNTAKPTVFWQVEMKPLFTAGSQTFSDEMIQKAGGQNSFGQDIQSYRQISVEAVIQKNPDFIIVSGINRLADSLEFWKKYSSVSAVKNGRIFAIDEHITSSPTPVTFVEAVKKIQDFLATSPTPTQPRQKT